MSKQKMETETVEATVFFRVSYDTSREGAREHAIRRIRDSVGHVDVSGAHRDFGAYGIRFGGCETRQGAHADA
jgi:hypothetical protein